MLLFWEVVMLKVRDCMTRDIISIGEDESAATAARIMARHNVGSLPVRGRGGRLTGMVTDRDLVLRCLACGQSAEHTPIGQVMTTRVVSAAPDDNLFSAAERMAQEQVRRLPVVEGGRLVGMLTLADVSRREDYSMEAAAALTEISRNVKKR